MNEPSRSRELRPLVLYCGEDRYTLRFAEGDSSEVFTSLESAIARAAEWVKEPTTLTAFDSSHRPFLVTMIHPANAAEKSP